MREIFRKEAVERLSSPERLDQLMTVVRPRDWLVLVTFALLAALAVCWSIWGRLPVTVTGRGVLIHPREIVDIQAPASGRIANLTMRVGDRVKPGDLLGTLDQSDIQQALQQARRRLQKLTAQNQEKNELQAQQTVLQIQQIELEKRSIGLQQTDVLKRLRDAEAKTPLLVQRANSRRQLERRGLIPRLSDERLKAEQVYLENQDLIAALKADLKQLQGKLKQLAGQEKHIALQNLERSTARQNTIQDVQSQIALYDGQLSRQSQIVSAHEGRIFEITVTIGEHVQQGMRLGSIDAAAPESPLIGLTYFPIKAGKKVATGMAIQIAPDTVERERFGSIVGKVTSVSSFPVTKAGIASLVGHIDVVDMLVEQGPPIEVRAELMRDPSTLSQYQWSSSQGASRLITSGTTATARVVVEYRAPITYVLPILREFSGL